jgi:hypothetical protein
MPGVPGVALAWDVADEMPVQAGTHRTGPATPPNPATATTPPLVGLVRQEQVANRRGQARQLALGQLGQRRRVVPVSEVVEQVETVLDRGGQGGDEYLIHGRPPAQLGFPAPMSVAPAAAGDHVDFGIAMMRPTHRHDAPDRIQ